MINLLERQAKIGTVNMWTVFIILTYDIEIVTMLLQKNILFYAKKNDAIMSEFWL